MSREIWNEHNGDRAVKRAKISHEEGRNGGNWGKEGEKHSNGDRSPSQSSCSRSPPAAPSRSVTARSPRGTTAATSDDGSAAPSPSSNHTSPYESRSQMSPAAANHTSPMAVINHMSIAAMTNHFPAAAANHMSPGAASGIQMSPTAASTNHMSPAVVATNHMSPGAAATNQMSPSSAGRTSPVNFNHISTSSSKMSRKSSAAEKPSAVSLRSPQSAPDMSSIGVQLSPAASRKSPSVAAPLSPAAARKSTSAAGFSPIPRSPASVDSRMSPPLTVPYKSSAIPADFLIATSPLAGDGDSARRSAAFTVSDIGRLPAASLGGLSNGLLTNFPTSSKTTELFGTKNPPTYLSFPSDYKSSTVYSAPSTGVETLGSYLINCIAGGSRNRSGSVSSGTKSNPGSFSERSSYNSSSGGSVASGGINHISGSEGGAAAGGNLYNGRTTPGRYSPSAGSSRKYSGYTDTTSSSLLSSSAGVEGAGASPSRYPPLSSLGGTSPASGGDEVREGRQVEGARLNNAHDVGVLSQPQHHQLPCLPINLKITSSRSESNPGSPRSSHTQYEPANQRHHHQEYHHSYSNHSQHRQDDRTHPSEQLNDRPHLSLNDRPHSSLNDRPHPSPHLNDRPHPSPQQLNDRPHPSPQLLNDRSHPLNDRPLPSQQQFNDRSQQLNNRSYPSENNRPHPSQSDGPHPPLNDRPHLSLNDRPQVRQLQRPQHRSSPSGGSSSERSPDGEEGSERVDPGPTEQQQVAASIGRRLREVFEAAEGSTSNAIVLQETTKSLALYYGSLTNAERALFMRTLASQYSTDHNAIENLAGRMPAALARVGRSPMQMYRMEERIRTALIPRYHHLFIQFSRLDGGIAFLVNFRADLITMLRAPGLDQDSSSLQAMNSTLHNLLALWLSPGSLQLERITWKSPCDLLQKISAYEAVQPIRNWSDLRKRVGPYRRCFAFTHPCLPREPVIVVHVALAPNISRSIQTFASDRPVVGGSFSESDTLDDSGREDISAIRAAIFYSITSTQKGLQGVELGNNLIKRIIQELSQDFPQLTDFSSLSPIPGFRDWLLEELANYIRIKKMGEQPPKEVLTDPEVAEISAAFNCSEGATYELLREVLKGETWVDQPHLTQILSGTLLRLCARYLYVEKRRGYAINPVANFHLRNGAVLWRLNWMSDTSSRGLSGSCSIMANYRYYPEQADENMRNYVYRQVIPTSDLIKELIGGAAYVS